MKIRVHPIQLDYATKDGAQTCGLCGAEERSTATHSATVSPTVRRRAVHLVHLVKAHLAEVQATFRDRKSEITIDAEEV